MLIFKVYRKLDIGSIHNIKDLGIPEPPSQNTLPMATPGCACLPPGRRIHHLNMQGHMVMAQILQWLRLSFCHEAL
jgi:hypothetical protein